MSTVTVSLPADGSTGTVSQYNTPLTTIVNEFNGNIDNANIKSGAAIATSKLADDAGLTTAKIANGAITANKLATGADVAVVATQESTTSLTFVSLTTITDSVSVTIGNNGLALVTISCAAFHGTNDLPTFMGFAASGTNTIAATDTQALIQRQPSSSAVVRSSYTKLLKGLAPGLTTFAAKYHVSSGTGSFKDREISVVPL